MSSLIDRVWDMEVVGGLSLSERGKIVEALRDNERLRAGLEKIRDYPDRNDVSDNLAKTWLRMMAGKILRNESVE